MPFDTDRIKKQIISALDANERDAGGLRLYSLVSGDEGFIGEEIDTAIVFGGMEVLRAIAETDGHSARGSLVVETAVAHGDQLPEHHGSHGFPTITPYDGAAFTLPGQVKSYDEIESYRVNPDIGYGKMYSDYDHDQVGENNSASPLAGYFAVNDNKFYFTGFSATVPLAIVTEDSIENIPAIYEPIVFDLAFGHLAKDGTISEKFSERMSLGLAALNSIRTGKYTPPNIKPSIGMRDRGDK